MTSSGISGSVRDDSGAPVAGAVVTAIYTPTNSTYTSTTSAGGRFNMRGLNVGGPYVVTVTADGFATTKQSDVYTQLASDIELNLALRAGDVVAMEAFNVQADSNDLDGGALGAGSVLNNNRISLKPSTERSLADIVSASPLVTLRSTFGDREESQITAVGQNNRFNSFQIDGSRINDQFGLNGTGLASFFNPLSLEWVEQVAVQISPYDVRQSGFTGASINLVTKSGTNEFKGATYYLFRGDELMGIQLQGNNAREEELTGTKTVPKLERSTWGVYVGGPILKDRLFFFLGYEKFESTSAGRDPRFDAGTNEATILSQLNKYSTAAGKSIDWGNPVTSATTNLSEDEKKIAKIDWKISDQHRMSVRYLTAEGVVPQFGNFASSSGNVNSVTGGVTSSSDGHFYSQTREEKSIAAQVYSDWTPDFKTELRYATTSQDQLTPVNSIAPLVYITGVPGTDLLNNSSVSGSYFAGTEQFRQGNEIGVDSDQFYAAGDYFWNDWVFTAGFEREQTDFYNLFRQGSYGLVAYRNYADFLADTNAVITRNVYDPNVRPVGDISDFATNGLFLNGKWAATSKLTLNLGLRYEFAESGPGPSLNQALLTATGFRNDGTPDGVRTISPRVGFTLALDDDRKMQLSGGVGHFLGRAPWVIFSNSYGSTGVGGFTLTSAGGELPSTLTGYLAQFDPENPIGTGTDNPTLRREINWNDDKIEMPSLWRGNLRFERKVDFLSSIVSAELVHSQVDQALFIREENLKATSVGADGRQRFAGSPAAGVGANALYPQFTNLLHVTNASVGESTYFTLAWDRPMKDSWGFNVAYIHGDATEAQSIGQTTAGGQWNRNVVFNQNTVEEGTADFEVRDRVTLSVSKGFEFVRNWKSVFSLYYEGRTGNPYSWVYTTDLNGDSRSDNDTVAVPSGLDDPRFDFSGMSATDQAAYFAFIEASGLSDYAGGIAPKNAWQEPWINQLSLHVEQIIPIYSPARLKLFFDFVNLGSFISKDMFNYTEISPYLSNDVFRTRKLGGASYGADGRIKPTYPSEPLGFNIDNGMSRWRVQLGAKLEF